MADDRTFVLIGQFQDGITPALEKINGSINQLKANLGTFAGKKGSFSELTQSLGKVIGAHKKLSEEVKTLRNELRESLPVLREYRKEVGKAVSANVNLAKGKYVKKNNPYLKFLSDAKKETSELAAITKKVQFGSRIPRRNRGGGGGGTGGGGIDVGMRTPRPPRPPRAPRVSYGGGGGGGGYIPPTRPSSTFGTKKFGVSRDETFAFGQTLGFTLGSTITGAIVQGFQIGVGFMMKPFQMFAGALQERVQDELSDISAAGGLLSVAKRQKGNPLVQSFQDAMDLTQITNKRMAEIAAALPGNTQQYIEVGKRLSDTAARMIALDPAKAIKYAQELAVKEGAGRTISTQKDAYTQIIGNMATQGVLAGLGDGGGTGARGITGAYGLPQLMERIYNEDMVTMGQFQRYAAIFRDPKISDALERFIPKINATMKGSIDRARIMDKFFEEVLPPEMIRAFERSTAGIMEAFRTGLFGPETGILGLGRKFENMGKKMDAYGRYIDDKGVVTSFEKAATVSLSLFDMLRDIFANVSIVLYPLIDILPQIFDPLKSIGDLLVDARHITGQFLQTFENYVAGLDGLLKTTKKGNADFGKTKKARAGLLAIANFMTDIGAFSEAQFEGLRLDILNKPSKELGEVLNKILTTFFESDTAKDIGNLIGSVIGTTLKQVATVIEYVLGVSKTSKLAEGLKDGFYAAGGPEAVRSIIQNIFKGLFTAIVEIFKIAPAEFSAILSAALLIPAFVSSFSILLANKLESVLEFANKAVGAKLKTSSISESRALYNLDKAKPRISASQGALVRPGAPKSAAFRAIPDMPYKNPNFPFIATGMRKGVGGVTGPYRAPGVPKPKEGLQGVKWLQRWFDEKVAGSGLLSGDVTRTKDFGKNLNIAGKGLKVQIVSVSKNAFTGAKGFAGGLAGKLGAGGLAGLKNPVGMLGKFGVALAGVTGILNGIVRFFATGDVFKSLGAIAGPIIGNILGFAIAGPLGAFIGGWILSQSQVTDKIGEVFQQVAASMSSVSESLAATGSDLLKFVQSLTGAETEAQAFQQLLAGINIILFPLTATFDALAVGASLVRIAFLEVIMFIDKAFQNGKRQKELASDYLEANRSLTRLIAANDEKYAKISRRKGDTGTLGGKEVTWNGTEWVGADGKPVKGGKPSTPTSTSVPASGSPVAPAAAVTAAPKEIAQTATNTQQLSQKASTQITQAAGIRVATQQTQKNTATANTTLGNIRAGIFAVSNRLNNIQAGIMSMSSLLQSGSLKVQMAFTPPGGGLGGSQGGPGIYDSMASSMGLQMTSGYRPGDPGYHGLNRARDYSNSTGPTPQMLAFATFLANTFGKNLKELIYTPLGYSIKDGVKVPPYAQDSHYNHVHVAYAQGLGNPAFFSNQKDAASWEKQHLGAGVKSITTNSAELSNLLAQVRYQSAPKSKKNWMQILDEDYQRNINKPIRSGTPRTSGRGGLDMWEGPQAYIPPSSLQSPASRGQMASAPMNITVPITVNQQPGEDGEALANRVATLFYDAMNNAQSASIFS
jgi:hypothetical protein